MIILFINFMYLTFFSFIILSKKNVEMKLELKKINLTKEELKKKLNLKNEKSFDELIEENNKQLKESIDKKIEESKQKYIKIFEEKMKEKDNEINKLKENINSLKNENNERINELKNIIDQFISRQSPMNQPPIGPPPFNQPPMGQPPIQPPLGPPPFNQPTIGQPPIQPPIQLNMSVSPPKVIQPSLIQTQMTQSILTQNISLPPGVIPHKSGDNFQPGNWIEIQEPKINMGFGWDFHGTKAFDLDSSVTGFDSNYNVIESIYFSNERGLKGSVIHLGDNTTGEGDDEIIKIDLDHVPIRVRFLAVTINSYKKNSLIGVKSIYIRLFTDTYHIGKYVLINNKDTNGVLLGVFERNPNLNKWYFRVMSDSIHGNKVTLSYEDIKTLLKNNSMKEIDNKPKIVHPLPGEPLIPFNKWIKLNNRFSNITLGWHLQQGFNNNLNDSIIFFGQNNNLIEINHKNISLNAAINYNNNNLIGMDEDDKEIRTIDFAKVNYDVYTI